MPKVATKVNRELLVRAIDEVERLCPCKGLTELYERASAIYNAADSHPIPISPSIVRSRIIEWKLSIKTVSPRKKHDKVIRTTSPSDHFEFLEEDVPARWRGLIKSIKKGSRKAAIKLHCIQCFGYEDGVVDMIRTCTGHKKCPLWSLRPYK